ATSDLRNGKPADTAAVRDVGFEAAVARIDAEILALKASVEQNAQLALELAEQAYVIETGRIVMSGSAKEIANNEDIRKSYL
ncbi:hypothetical protein ABTB62_20260, partial [Acinetobacter baumannii]